MFRKVCRSTDKKRFLIQLLSLLPPKYPRINAYKIPNLVKSYRSFFQKSVKESDNIIKIMKLNLELRTQILDYSLHLEEGVNNLLLLNLGIFDGGKASRLFGNRAGISFNNKIALLYDIDVFTKAENSEMELLSIFRNKFLHDINSNSLLTVIKSLDSGVKAKFKQFIAHDGSIENESDCNQALISLFVKNIKTLKLKTRSLRELNDKKNQLLQSYLQQNIKTIDLFFDLLRELTIKLEKSKLEDPNVLALSNDILISITKFEQQFSEMGKPVFDFDVFASLFGVRKMPQEANSDLRKIFDEYIAAASKPNE